MHSFPWLKNLIVLSGTIASFLHGSICWKIMDCHAFVVVDERGNVGSSSSRRRREQGDALHFTRPSPLSTLLAPLQRKLQQTGKKDNDNDEPPSQMIGRKRPHRRRVQDTNTTTTATATSDLNSTDPKIANKALKICSVLGGLDITRLQSSQARSVFSGAMFDVELFREYFYEAVLNDGLKSPYSDLETLAATLDWKARNLSSSLNTLTAGLGWSDDRPDRRMDHLTSNSTNLPFVGDKQSDSSMLHTFSNIIPWVVDRETKEHLWLIHHENGRSEAPDMAPLNFDSLYQAGYSLSWADTIVYYPPLAALQPGLSIADLMGGSLDSHTFVIGAGFLPDENPDHLAAFYGPYEDVAVPGNALITATAPVYFTGTFQNFTYNNTYITHVGLDISLLSVSALFDNLQDSLTEGSFALLVASDNLAPVCISQAVVEKIYPARTGMEESRVTYQTSDQSIEEDRRNQTYRVSDTIHQSLLQNVTSADWAVLREEIMSHERGSRGFTILNLTLTGSTDNTPVEYYVMFDRWKYVSDWTLLVLAPVTAVERAISVSYEHDTLELVVDQEQQQSSAPLTSSMTIINNGTLDVRIQPVSWPDWLIFTGPGAAWMNSERKVVSRNNTVPLAAGDRYVVDFSVDSSHFDPGTVISSTVSFRVSDDNYNDCFYDHDISLDIALKIGNIPHLNLIGKTVIAGYILMAILLLCSLGFIGWIVLNREKRIVRHSQPLFLILLCCGTIVMSLAIVPLSMDDDNSSPQAASSACMAVPWLVSMGFTISFSALFSKIWRINQIFHNPRFKRVKVTEKDVLVPFVMLFTLNFGLLLAWTLIDPLRFERRRVDPTNNNPLDTYGTCTFTRNGTFGFALGTVLVNFGALLIACIQAYRAREISDEFSESKWVGTTIASWLQVFMVGFPVMFLVNENPTATYFLRASIIFVACMSLLLFIFVPKLLHKEKPRGPRVSIFQEPVLKVSTENTVSIHLGGGGNNNDDSMHTRENTKVDRAQQQHASVSFSIPDMNDSGGGAGHRDGAPVKLSNISSMSEPASTTMSHDSSSHGFGLKIVRHPAIPNEAAMLSHIRDLEDRLERFERQQQQEQPANRRPAVRGQTSNRAISPAHNSNAPVEHEALEERVPEQQQQLDEVTRTTAAAGVTGESVEQHVPTDDDATNNRQHYPATTGGGARTAVVALDHDSSPSLDHDLESSQNFDMATDMEENDPVAVVATAAGAAAASGSEPQSPTPEDKHNDGDDEESQIHVV